MLRLFNTHHLKWWVKGYGPRGLKSAKAAGAVGQEMATVGAGITQENLNIQPTLKIGEGYAFNIFVNKVMIFPKA